MSDSSKSIAFASVGVLLSVVVAVQLASPVVGLVFLGINLALIGFYLWRSRNGGNEGV